eukprot:TRINITY_DN47376_c0_g1_i1.p1 TRINITY_DN47376_c0_g1~~TRINITY_DN47376_c0_g1_i1.p1  ORF type:complete len:525 (+),score=131.10 TRINITY_DN47376_c0_g1_i1:43-1617(+)
MPPDRKRALEVQSLEAMEAMLEHHLEQAKKRLKEMDDDEAFDEQWDGTTNCKDMEGARKMVVDAEQLEVGGDYFGGGMDNKDTLEIQEMYGSEVYACDPGSCISTPRDWTKPESTALHKAVFIQCARTRELHNLFQEKHADPATEPLIFTPPPTITWSEAYRYIEDFTLADWQDVSTVYNSLKVDIYQIRGAIDCLLQWHHNESLLLPKGATYQEAIVCHATRQVPESKMSLERIRTECQLNKVEPTISQITHAAGRLQQNLLFEEDEMVKFLELLGVYGTGNPEFIAAKMQDAFPRMKGVGLAEFKGIIGEFANWDGSVVSDKQPETLKEAVCNMEIVRRSRLKPPVKWALDLAGVGWLSQMRPEVAKHFEASHTTRSLKRIELLASAGTTGALTRDHVAVLKASHITPFRRVTRCGVSRPTLKPPVSGLPVIHASQYSQKAFSSMMEALCGHAPGQTATFTKAYNEAARRDYEMIEQDPEQNKLLEATNAHPSTMVFVSALTAAFEGVLLNGALHCTHSDVF